MPCNAYTLSLNCHINGCRRDAAWTTAYHPSRWLSYVFCITGHLADLRSRVRCRAQRLDFYNFGGLVGFSLLAVMLRLQLMFPGISIFKIAELSLGRIPGKILNGVFLYVIFVIALLSLGDLVTMLRQLFPYAPQFSLRTIIILTVAYCLYKGVTNVARLTEAALGYTLLFIAIGFLVPANMVDLSNLQPVLSDWRTMLGAIAYGANWPYAQIAVLVLLLPMVTDLQKGYPKLVTGIS